MNDGLPAPAARQQELFLAALEMSSASEDGTLRLWDARAHQEILSFPTLGRHVSGLLFSPDGRVLAASAGARGQPPRLRLYRAPLLEKIDREGR